MKNQNALGFSCRHCHHYQIEGRRGGRCQQLSSSVHGHWRACPFYVAPFAPTWELALCKLDRVFLAYKDRGITPHSAGNKRYTPTSLSMAKGLDPSFPKALLSH